MKKFVYELFEVYGRDTGQQLDYSHGQFSSLNAVRAFVTKELKRIPCLLPEDFEVYRRILNEGADCPVLVEGWQKLIN